MSVERQGGAGVLRSDPQIRAVGMLESLGGGQVAWHRLPWAGGVTTAHPLLSPSALSSLPPTHSFLTSIAWLATSELWKRCWGDTGHLLAHPAALPILLQEGVPVHFSPKAAVYFLPYSLSCDHLQTPAVQSQSSGHRKPLAFRLVRSKLKNPLPQWHSPHVKG